MMFGIISFLVWQVMTDFPQHVIRVAQCLYLGTELVTDKQQFEIGKKW
jgi:hypothetical protein